MKICLVTTPIRPIPTTFPLPTIEPEPNAFKSGSCVSKSIAIVSACLKSGNSVGLTHSVCALKIILDNNINKEESSASYDVEYEMAPSLYFIERIL